MYSARPTDVQVKAWKDMPNRKGGSMKNQIALVHALAHIEGFAIDLSWDILLRFATNRVTAEVDHLIECIDSEKREFLDKHVGNRNIKLPKEFFEDWFKVAQDEARHFTIWSARLKEMGSYYGALPTHNGLWDAARQTSHDVLARLSIVHMVHEGHGLDVSVGIHKKMLRHKDKKSADTMVIIERDEITHT
eukprot:UN24109